MDTNWWLLIESRQLVKDFVCDSKRRHYPINSGYIMNTETKQDDILNDLTLYQSLVGTLHYINSLCRPDISYITNYLARKTRSASSRDLQIAKNVMVYLLTTANEGIAVKKPKKQELIVKVFTDSDFAGEVSDRKSITGYTIYLNETLIGYKSRKQKIITLSTFEAELLALVDGVKEAIFFRNVLKFMGVNVEDKIWAYCDNQAAIAGFQNNTRKTKYMEMRIMYLMEKMKEEIKLFYVESRSNPADLLTKNVREIIFDELKPKLVN